MIATFERETAPQARSFLRAARTAASVAILLACASQFACVDDGEPQNVHAVEDGSVPLDAQAEALPDGDAQSDGGTIEDAPVDRDVIDAAREDADAAWPDATGDVATDAPIDAAEDAPSDASSEASTDADVDASEDVGADGSADAFEGGGADAETCVIAGLQAGPPYVSAIPCMSSSLWAIAVCTDGSTKDVTQLVSWWTDDEAVASVDEHGNAMCLGGCQTTTVHAEYQGLAADLTLVCLCTDSWVEVLPAEATTTIGATARFEAWGSDSCGSYDMTQSLMWTTSEPSIAIVVAPGVIEGVAAGTTEVSTSWMLGGQSATLTVVAGP